MTTPSPAGPLHGGVVAGWSPARGWRGVWIVGPSGSGKSDLALRLIARGFRLVADDYAHVFASGSVLYAVAPEGIGGRMEARGVGILPVCARGVTRLALAVRLTTGPVERLPAPDKLVIDGVALSALTLDAREASAVEKVAAALAVL